MYKIFLTLFIAFIITSCSMAEHSTDDAKKAMEEKLVWNICTSSIPEKKDGFKSALNQCSQHPILIMNKKPGF